MEEGGQKIPKEVSEDPRFKEMLDGKRKSIELEMAYKLPETESN